MIYIGVFIISTTIIINLVKLLLRMQKTGRIDLEFREEAVKMATNGNSYLLKKIRKEDQADSITIIMATVMIMIFSYVAINCGIIFVKHFL